MSREVVDGARRLYGGKVNASNPTLLRALRGLAYAALLLTVFEACSGDDASTPTPPAGPASIEITGISLGYGFGGDQPATSALACDYRIGVNVQTTNWALSSPGRCGGALQCGQLRVTLLAPMPDGSADAELLQVMAAANGVSLDVRQANPALPADAIPYQYRIRAELIEDSGKPYVEVDGGNGSALRDLWVTVPKPEECEKAAGSAGAGGAHASEGNAGSAGDHALAGSGGSAGDHAAEATAGAAGAAEGGATSVQPQL